MYKLDGLTQNQTDDIRFCNVCLICGRPLYEYLDWQTKEKYLSCGNESHRGIIKKEIVRMESTALMAMPENKMMERVNMAKFPQDLTPADKKVLVLAARTYGFDPLMGEISVYQGRPYVSIDGRYRKAQETGQLDGVETRPATKEERADWQIPDGDYFFRAEVWLKGNTKPFVGWGRVNGSETTGGKGFKPVEKNPQRMAEKRAEAQALRKAFHIPLPSIEDIGSSDDQPEVKVSEGSEWEPEVVAENEPEETEHVCPLHNAVMKKHSNSEGQTWWSHYIVDTGEYCNGEKQHKPQQAKMEDRG